MAFGTPQPRTTGPAWKAIEARAAAKRRIADLEVANEAQRLEIDRLEALVAQLERRLKAQSRDEPTAVPLEDILDEVSRNHGFAPTEIRSASRRPALVRARHEFCYLAALLNHSSLPQIGRFLGGRDHTTVLHGIRAHCARTGRTLPRGMGFGKNAGTYERMAEKAGDPEAD